jgi:hypothetical protein
MPKEEKEASLSGVEQAYFKARNEIHELENKQRDNFRKQQELQRSGQPHQGQFLGCEI